MENIIFLIVGMILGAVVIWIYLNFKNLKNQQNKHQTISILEQKMTSLQQNLIEKKSLISTQQTKILTLTEQLAEEKTKREHQTLLLSEQTAQNTALQKKFSLQFELLAERIFDEKSTQFALENKHQMSQILDPLQHRIKDFETKVERMYSNEAKERFSLEKELKNLITLNYQLGEEASKLTNALKGQAKIQGNWGEMILESILEGSGLMLNHDFFIQKSFRDHQGRLFQPDVLIKYPGKRYIVVDSKVSLVAYETYCNTSDRNTQKKIAHDHVRSIKAHIQSLSNKDYQNLPHLHSLDFVLMFIPIESAYTTALQTDATLWQYAYERRVLPVGPVNLIAVLKMVSVLWQKELQNKNALEIAEKSGALYDKFVGLVDDLVQVGQKIEQANVTYQGAMKKLHTGKGNLMKRAEGLKELGAKTKKALPSNWINQPNEEPKDTK